MISTRNSLSWMPPVTLFVLMGTLVCLHGPVVSAATGKALYNQARQTTDLPSRVRLLQASVEKQRTFSAFLQLSLAHFQLAQYGPSKTAVQEALNLAQGAEAGALALAQLGRVHLALENENDGILFLRRSLRLQPRPEVRALMKRVETHRSKNPVSADYITRSLTSRSTRALFVVEKKTEQSTPFPTGPTLDLRVHFDFAKSSLTPVGRAQVGELARALMDPTLADHRVLLTGHTDTRGDAQYNQGLSEKRARSVADELVQVHGIAAHRLRTAGAGEQRPLFPGRDETEHALNRRVEVGLE